MSTAVAASKMAKATKPKTEKKAPAHPAFAVMVQAAISTLNDKKGSSRAAIHNYIVANYKLEESAEKINARLRSSLKKGTESGVLTLTKGVGAAGSFSLGEKKASKAKSVAKNTVKKPVAKKAAGAAAASPKKTKTTKPKAAKKTSAPKKAATPKKTKAVTKLAKKTATKAKSTKA